MQLAAFCKQFQQDDLMPGLKDADIRERRGCLLWVFGGRKGNVASRLKY